MLAKENDLMVELHAETNTLKRSLFVFDINNN
jgi:hypothetical protein